MTETITPFRIEIPQVDAFHPVVPSLPGLGFSSPATEAGWGTARIAGVRAFR